MIPEMQHAVDDPFGLLGDPGGHADPPEREARAAARRAVGVLALDGVTVDGRRVGILGEERVHGVVRRDALERDARRPDRLLVDAAPVAGLRDVALRPRQRLEKRRLEIRVREELPRELEGPPGVLEDLAGLDAFDVVEEPAAARVHELRVPLHLEELQRADALGALRRARRVAPEIPGDVFRGAVEDHLDVVVARGPGVPEELRGGLLVEGRQRVAKCVERLAERGPPVLTPCGVGLRPAAAVAPPALHAMGAAPGRGLDDPDFVRRRVGLEKLGVVRQARPPGLLDGVKRVGERHVAVTVMVAVGLAVGGDVHELGALARVVEGPHEALGQVVAAREENRIEGDGARHRPVEEEDRDRGSRRQRHAVGPRRIDAFRRDLDPLTLSGADVARLMRREDRETDPGRGERFERGQIHRGLGQPHPLRRPAEAALEVADAPDDLRRLVAGVGERKDRVVVRLRDRRAVPREARGARAVGFEDRGVDVGPPGLEPGQKRRPEVEAHRRVVVDDRDDAVLAVEDPGARVRARSTRR